LSHLRTAGAPDLLRRPRPRGRDVRRDARIRADLADRPRNPHPPAMIIYLHGFRSAPASHKAQALKQRMQERGLAHAFWCEQLPHVPARAVALIEHAILEAPERNPGHAPTLAGSSLGGYYATFLAERHGLRAAVINPAVLAPLDLEPWIGTQTNLYTGEA